MGIVLRDAIDMTTKYEFINKCNEVDPEMIRGYVLKVNDN